MSAVWMLRTALRRMLADARLLLVAFALAVAATTAIAALVLLIVVTEPAGLRSTLTGATDASVDITVDVFRPAVPVGAVTDAATTAVQDSVLGGLDVTTASTAVTDFARVPDRDEDTPALTYLAQYDDFADNADLVSGSFPEAASDTAPDAASGASTREVAVAIPDAAAQAFGLAVGDRLSVEAGAKDAPVSVRVVGVYRAHDPTSAFWANDPFAGQGDVPGFPKPRVSVYVPVHGFGPLVAGTGALDAAGVPVQRIGITIRPHFSAVTAEQLPALNEHLGELPEAITVGVGNIADSVSSSSDLPATVARASANLVVTRSTVAVVVLLLLVVALFALAQTAGLLTDSRAVQRGLFRARGGSTGQLLAMSVFEGVILAVATLALAPVLAGLVYTAIATLPAMTAAGMPRGFTVPPSVWAVSAGVAAAFVVVLAAPVLRADREDDRSSRGRAGGLLRAGIDLAVVVVAGVALVRLLAYRSPVDPQAAFAIDPVLVAAPTLVLVAGALVAAHLIPLAGKPLDALASRSRRVVLPLATWEVARRARSATAAVLLLTLALGVSSFGVVFLSTWRQAQVDQATLALGAPVVVSADGVDPASRRAELAGGAIGEPQPVMRRSARLATAGAELTADDSRGVASATVLGLPESAMPLIQRGRLGAEGGDDVAKGLAAERAAGITDGVELGDEMRGVAATVTVGDADAPLPGATARIYAVLENSAGLLGTLDLGSAVLDGQPVALRGVLPAASAEESVPASAQPAAAQADDERMRLVGLQVDIFASDPEGYASQPGASAEVLVGDVAALTGPPATEAAGLTARPVEMAPATAWKASTNVKFGEAPLTGDVPVGSQLRMDVQLPTDLAVNPASYVLLGWLPTTGLAAVVSEELVEQLGLTDVMPLSLGIAGARVPIVLSGSAALVPGVSGSSLRTGVDGPEGAVVVVDQQALARSLVQAGQHGTSVDEWWVDVPDGTGETYAAAHPSPAGRQPTLSVDGLARALQSGPLRIAAQAALLLVVGGSAVLAAIGFAAHTAATVRARRLEFAQLRAIGLPRSALTGLIAAEALVVGALGIVFGVAIGLLLSTMTAPVVAVSPSGAPAVPSVVVSIPWLQVGALALGLVAVIAVVVSVVGLRQRLEEPASALRGAAE
ncbi:MULTISPECIES: ABC transporter permease [unclassified Leifsonia]|uniref:ABC transporter permease n=1 Tax=unclassified Leifsonia TaxID=2663824 RepID=UPI000701922E|nr:MULTISPECIES: ABC transporter permease [unclassified Leifsonia]KQX08186.1 hypothetical protein ASC59_11010 [Leifsonia sp. Root1293]KRA12468.1 hypothetical protein ASD61_11010 [Leifsonia sp. Root60]